MSCCMDDMNKVMSSEQAMMASDCHENMNSEEPEQMAADCECVMCFSQSLSFTKLGKDITVQPLKYTITSNRLNGWTPLLTKAPPRLFS